MDNISERRRKGTINRTKETIMYKGKWFISEGLHDKYLDHEAKYLTHVLGKYHTQHSDLNRVNPVHILELGCIDEYTLEFLYNKMSTGYEVEIRSFGEKNQYRHDGKEADTDLDKTYVIVVFIHERVKEHPIQPSLFEADLPLIMDVYKSHKFKQN